MDALDVDILQLAKKLALFHLCGYFSPQMEDEIENFGRLNDGAWPFVPWGAVDSCVDPFLNQSPLSNCNVANMQGQQDWTFEENFTNQFEPNFNSDYGSSENGSVVDPLDWADENSANKSFEELAIAFRPEIPRPGYICNICRIPGHFIQYCPQAPTVAKTPYQGNKQCIGLFICHKCKRQWKSNKSFAGIGQQCKKCHVLVHPKKQFPLRCSPSNCLSLRGNGRTPHQMDLDSDALVTPSPRRSSKQLPSLTSDFFESCSALQTPSPSPFSLRHFEY